MELAKLAKAKELETEIRDTKNHVASFNNYRDRHHSSNVLERCMLMINTRDSSSLYLLNHFLNIDDFIELYKLRAEAHISNLEKQLDEL